MRLQVILANSSKFVSNVYKICLILPSTKTGPRESFMEVASHYSSAP